jgi:hypothetical protein
MIEDLPDDRRPLDHGDHLHRAAATRTQEGIDLVHLPDEAGPGAADLKGRPIVRAGDWVRRLGFREEPVPLAVAPRTIGVIDVPHFVDVPHFERAAGAVHTDLPEAFLLFLPLDPAASLI